MEPSVVRSTPSDSVEERRAETAPVSPEPAAADHSTDHGHRTTDKPRRRHRGRRWLFRLFITVIVLAVILGIGVQLVL